MNRRAASHHPSLALLVLAVVCLLVTPLDYRAGARSPHPHAAAQLLIELASGSLHHHPGSVAPNSTLSPAMRLRAGASPQTATLAVDPPGAAAVASDPTGDLPHMGTASQTAKISALPLLAALGFIDLGRWLMATLLWFQPLPLRAVTMPPPAPPPRRTIRLTGYDLQSSAPSNGKGHP